MCRWLMVGGSNHDKDQRNKWNADGRKVEVTLSTPAGKS
jgi:hypothetical protein